MHNGRPVLAATVGPASGPTIVLHGHLDVVPGRDGAVRAAHRRRPPDRARRLRHEGRARLDDVRAPRRRRRRSGVRVHFVCVADEESEEVDDRGSDYLVRAGYIGDFAITGEPTDLHIGIQAKGVLAMRIEVTGTAAHGSTPWVGDNAVLKAIDVFRQIESLPFARESSDLFDRPSINLGRILGGDALNKVPDLCVIDVDVRYLPGQDPEAIKAAVEDLPDATVVHVFHRQPAIVERDDPYVQALGAAIARVAEPTSERPRRRPRRRLRRHLLPRGRRPGGRVRPYRRAAITAPRSGCRSGRSASIERALVEFVNLLPARLDAGGEEAPASGSPDVRRHPPPRTLEAPPARRRSWWCSRPPAPRPWRRSTRSTRWSSALELGPELKLGKDTLATTDPGEAQTLLILGSDRRPRNNSEGAGGARSDTIMLVRLNPDKDATAIMSLPRDLKVEIPGHGVDKINAAYSTAGPAAHARDREEAHGPAHQPRRQRDLQGLLARGERDRLRVHGHGPRLLQRQRRVHVHRHRPRLPAAVRAPGAPVRALPP